jgi:hypothetical protein
MSGRTILNPRPTKEVWTVKNQMIEGSVRRFFKRTSDVRRVPCCGFGPRMLAGLTIVGTLALAAPAWASSVAGSPASDGTTSAHALPTHPHSVMDAPGSACGCSVRSPAAGSARAGAAPSHGSSMREGHARAGGRMGATLPAATRSSAASHFMRYSRRH